MVVRATPNDSPMDVLRDVLLDEPAEHVVREVLRQALAGGADPAVILAELPMLGEHRLREALAAAAAILEQRYVTLDLGPTRLRVPARPS